jgi:hypothetical protein
LRTARKSGRRKRRRRSWQSPPPNRHLSEGVSYRCITRSSSILCVFHSPTPVDGTPPRRHGNYLPIQPATCAPHRASELAAARPLQPYVYTDIVPAFGFPRSFAPISTQPDKHSTRVLPKGASIASINSGSALSAWPTVHPIPSRRKPQKTCLMIVMEFPLGVLANAR